MYLKYIVWHLRRIQNYAYVFLFLPCHLLVQDIAVSGIQL